MNGMELITTALHQPIHFSWWWLAVPAGIGLLMIVVGIALREGAPAGIGTMILILGTLFTALGNASGPAYDADLLRSDMADQLQIEETVKDGDWYTGRGPDGKFVKFTLVEKDGVDDTYAVLVEK